MPCIIILFLIRFKMHLYLIESTHRKGYSNELASFFRINTFGRLNDGFISIFSSHVAKIRVYTEISIYRLEILSDQTIDEIRSG